MRRARPSTRTDAYPPVSAIAPSRFFDVETGACVARFTAGSTTLLVILGLDFSSPAATWSVTIVARLRLHGTNARVLSSYCADGACPGARDFVLRWHDNSANVLLAGSGGWVGGQAGSEAAGDERDSSDWVRRHDDTLQVRLHRRYGHV